MYSLKSEAGPVGSDLMSYDFACNFVYLLLITKHMKASPGASSSDSRSCLIWLGLEFWPEAHSCLRSGLSREPGGGQVRPLHCTTLHATGRGDGSRLSIVVVDSANLSFLEISRSHGMWKEWSLPTGIWIMPGASRALISSRPGCVKHRWLLPGWGRGAWSETWVAVSVMFPAILAPFLLGYPCIF